MKHNLFLTVLLVAISVAMPFRSHAYEFDSHIKTIFSTATYLKAFDGGWMEVYDEGNTLLGYAAYSKPYSDGINGYNGETPLLIGFDDQKRVLAVLILDNTETPRFVNYAKANGLFNRWDKMTVKEALAAEPDVVSGATYTSRGVIQSFNACVSHLEQAGFTDEKKNKSGLFLVGGLFFGSLLLVAISRRLRQKAISAA